MTATCRNGHVREGSYCKPCSRAASARWKAAHPEQAKASARSWYRRQGAAANRAVNLRRWYGISVEEYDALLKAQGGMCAICKRPETRRIGPEGGTRPLSVDHDHETNAVRGLLCSRCNSALGMLDEDPGLLAAAVAYLKGRVPLRVR